MAGSLHRRIDGFSIVPLFTCVLLLVLASGARAAANPRDFNDFTLGVFVRLQTARAAARRPH